MEWYWFILAAIFGFIWYRRRDCKISIDLSNLGKWAIVTGATDGIGKAFALELARKGFNVVLVSRTKERLKNVAKEIENQSTVSTKIIQAEFTTSDPEMYARIGSELMNLDIGLLVNNVGMSAPHPEYFADLDKHHSSILQDILNCNVASVVQMTRLVLPGMIERRRGLVVNVASGMALFPSPLQALYGSTKAFVTKFSESLDLECKDKGVHVHVLTTGVVMTKRTKIRNSSFFTPDPDTYAKSALEQIVNRKTCDGYIGHQIFTEIASAIFFLWPGLMNMYMMRLFGRMRDEGLKKCNDCNKSQ